MFGCAAALGLLAGCREDAKPVPARVRIGGVVVVVRDSVAGAVQEVTGTAQPRLSADLSTKLVGRVVSVEAREGQPIRSGQILASVDGSDLDAKAGAVASGLDASRAQLALAEAQARRIRSLYADGAVPKANLDQAESDLDRARAGVLQARSQEAELRSARGYARIVAPFPGRVVARMADPGMMASPGIPLLRVEDASVLRIAATTTSATAASIAVGSAVQARIDGRPVVARVEGVVPSGAGNLAQVNALVDNRDGKLPSGAVATLLLPKGFRRARLVPRAALVREGDLVGVWVRRSDGDLKRWIRTGGDFGNAVEVLSGLSEGDTVVVPSASERG